MTGAMSAFDPKRTFSIRFCRDAQYCFHPLGADLCGRVTLSECPFLGRLKWSMPHKL
jgi:hypothetical protein